MSAAECSWYIIWAVAGTFLSTATLCTVLMFLIWKCNLCRFRKATLQRIEERYRLSSLALPTESPHMVAHRYGGTTRGYAGPGGAHVNLGFQNDETADDFSGGSRFQVMVENGAVGNGHAHARAHAHTFHHYRKKSSAVSNVYESPMSVKRASEALRGRYATFPRAEPQHKFSTASGVYETPVDWPESAPDDRKVSSVSSYYESPVGSQDFAAGQDGDVLGQEGGWRKESSVSGLYENVEPSLKRRPEYRSDPDLAGDEDRREPRRKSTVYDAPMPELPPLEARHAPIPELATDPVYGDREMSDDERERRRKSTVYDAPMPELPPAAARRASVPEMRPREAQYEDYGRNSDDDDQVPPRPATDAPAPPTDAVPERPMGDAPAPPVGAVPERPTGNAPAPPTDAPPAFPEFAAEFQDGFAPAFQENLAPAFQEEGEPPTPQSRILSALPAFLSRDRQDSVGSMDTMTSEPLSERQTHFEMRKIDFDFIPVPDYPEDDVMPTNEAEDRRPLPRQHGRSFGSREEEDYRGYDTHVDVTYIP